MVTQDKQSSILTRIEPFQMVTPVWIHWNPNMAKSVFEGHTGQNIANLASILSFKMTRLVTAIQSLRFSVLTAELPKMVEWWLMNRSYNFLEYFRNAFASIHLILYIHILMVYITILLHIFTYGAGLLWPPATWQVLLTCITNLLPISWVSRVRIRVGLWCTCLCEQLVEFPNFHISMA